MTEQPPPDETQPMGSGQPAATSAGDPLVEWAIPETRPVPGRRQIVYADTPNRVIAYIVDLIAVGIIAIGAGLVLVLAFATGTGSTNVSSPFFSLIFNVVTANTVTMLARATFTAINKGASDTLKITWTVTIG